ncbi:conserved Plasmodium protein, unknown function [Plasmodium chabaudi adami]|uniref:SET domain-containing protein n=1 Tax=Plasmodium chabaudi adami TaxID=5826 RepID=A0A1C6YM73_PLACE|nr:conserved Plasmodium protein, unknown function [Plasmodium chabaudi adami]
MNTKFYVCFKYIIIIINATLYQCKRRKASKINLFPYFINNDFPSKPHNYSSGSKRKGILQKREYASHFSKTKGDALNLLSNEEISKNDIKLNNLTQLLENILIKKNEYKNTILNSNYNIDHLVDYFQDKLSGLQNINFIEQNRANYSYSKNKIREFFNDNNVKVDGKLQEHISAHNKPTEQYQNVFNKNIIKDEKNQCQFIEPKNNTSFDNRNTHQDHHDNILCMQAKTNIKKDDVILSIPKTYIIHYDNIMNQIQNFVNDFSNSYNVNYIKYIFKNNMQDQINQLDPYIILMYDIYKRHINFISFMKSPNIYLKYWDIKLTLLIAYIYFISKYMNILLHAHSFNNALFLLLDKYLSQENENLTPTELSHHKNEQRICEKKNGEEINSTSKNLINDIYLSGNNEIHENYKSTAIPNIVSNDINEISHHLRKTSENALKNRKSFFFYNNYEHYINYIVNTPSLNHLPLLFKESSFLLFNNANIKNIIYFRKQMIHEIINMYKNDEDNDNATFFSIDKNIINKILFTNNKYYSTIEKYFKNNIIYNENGSNNSYANKKHNNVIDLDKLYHFTLINKKNFCLSTKNTNCQKESSTQHVSINDMSSNTTNDDNNNNVHAEQSLKENSQSSFSFANFRDSITSIIYNASLFDNFDIFFNYSFLMHIYSYVSSHAIKIKSDAYFFQNIEENNIQKVEKSNRKNENDYGDLKDNILNSNITIKETNKHIEKISAKECSKYDFNEYEKKEKQTENKHMCLIPFIDVCNHRTFSMNSFIKNVSKDIKKNTHSFSINNNDANYSYHNLLSDNKNPDSFSKTHQINPVYKHIEPIDIVDEKNNYNTNSSDSDINKVCDTKNLHNTNEIMLEDANSIQLFSSENINTGDEITISYGKLSNDLLLLEYGFIDKKNTKVYFYFDVKIIREIIIQILGHDKLPLIMLESLERKKVDIFKILNVLPNNENVYERFQTDQTENAEIVRQKKNILNDYIRKNKYFNEYNIFTMKERINQFYIDEKMSHDQKNKKSYFYIGTDLIVDPILLATIRTIIYDDMDYLSKINITDLLQWENYLSPDSEIIVIQVLIKLIDEIIYDQFYDINYEDILIKGQIKYEDLKCFKNKFLQPDLFNSEKVIDIFQNNNNFNIVIYNIMKLKELQLAKQALIEKREAMMNLLKTQDSKKQK